MRRDIGPTTSNIHEDNGRDYIKDKLETRFVCKEEYDLVLFGGEETDHFICAHTHTQRRQSFPLGSKWRRTSFIVIERHDMRVCRLGKDRRTLAHRLLFKTWESSNSLIFTFTGTDTRWLDVPAAGGTSSSGRQSIQALKTGDQEEREGRMKRNHAAAAAAAHHS